MDISKVDLTGPGHKVFAGILGAVGIGVVWFLLPSMIFFFQNLIWLGVLVATTGFLALNAGNIWNLLKMSSWKISKALIKQNKLFYMFKYHDYLVEKKKALDQQIDFIGKAQVSLTKNIVDLKQDLGTLIDKTRFLDKQEGKELEKRNNQGKIKILSDQIGALEPKLTTVQAQRATLMKISELQGADNELLYFTLVQKEKEYEQMKSVNSALQSASGFLRDNSQEYKDYQESLKLIEADIDQYVANFENFETRITPLLSAKNTDQDFNAEQGRKLIEDYENQFKLQISAPR